MQWVFAQDFVFSHADTWPQALTLVPAREPVVSTPELQAWMQRHRPGLATFQFQTQVPDPKTNEDNYRSLVQLLATKKIVRYYYLNIDPNVTEFYQYATAAWTTPSGGQGRNVLVFPLHGAGVVGAFFPLTGLPELPKPTQGLNPQGFPATMLAQLQQLDPERRNIVMTQFIRHRQLVSCKIILPMRTFKNLLVLSRGTAAAGTATATARLPYSRRCSIQSWTTHLAESCQYERSAEYDEPSKSSWRNDE
jgi:hypothetical protein